MMDFIVSCGQESSTSSSCVCYFIEKVFEIRQAEYPHHRVQHYHQYKRRREEQIAFAAVAGSSSSSECEISSIIIINR
jgi:hypothetical protein